MFRTPSPPSVSAKIVQKRSLTLWKAKRGRRDRFFADFDNLDGGLEHPRSQTRIQVIYYNIPMMNLRTPRGTLVLLFSLVVLECCSFLVMVGARPQQQQRRRQQVEAEEKEEGNRGGRHLQTCLLIAYGAISLVKKKKSTNFLCCKISFSV